MSPRARRRALASAAAVLAAGALVYAWRAATSREISGRGSAGVNVLVPPLPDVSRLEPSVQQQIRDRHASVRSALVSGASAPALAEELGALGKVLLATESPGAADAFESARTLAPSDMRWPYYLGHVHRLRQEAAPAIRMFERALQLVPDDVPTLVWLGDLHLAAGDAESAERYLRRAADLQPASAAAVERLGRAALSRRDYGRAIDLLERALALEPGAASVHYPLGMAYRGSGNIAKAEFHLRQAGDEASLPPDDPLMDSVALLLRNAAAYEARGMQALEARDWKTAVENLREAAARAPGNAIIRLNLGTALSLSGDPAAAREALLEAVRLAPDMAKAHFSLGLIAQDEGRWSEAVERLSTAVLHQPDFVDAHYALGEALRRTGQADQALEHYARVLELNPAASQARFGRAMALVRLGRWLDARSTLSEAFRLHPDQPGFPHALARVLAAAPDPQARDGRRALQLMEPLAASQAGPAVNETMAMAYAELGRFEEAVSWQQRAIAAARSGGQSQLAVRMTGNLDRYRRGQPCRTPWREDDPVIAAARQG
jgi:tetratricopeptide (TPR) repeat protein